MRITPVWSRSVFRNWPCRVASHYAVYRDFTRTDTCEPIREKIDSPT
jgi:hypothetical protein